MRKTNIRDILRSILYFPISPRSFQLAIDLLNGGRVRRKRADKSARFRNILISHPYTTVGDVVLILPLIEKISQFWPSAAIDIVIGSNMKELFVGHPLIRKVHCYSASNSKLSFIQRYLRVFQIVKLYRREIASFDYDLAIAPRWDSDPHAFLARYMVYMTNAPYRCSYSARVDGGDITIDNLLTHTPAGGSSEHEVLRYIRLLSRANLTVRDPQDASVVEAPIKRLADLASSVQTKDLPSEIFKEIGDISSRYVVISPGATNPRRIWPTEKLAELMKEIRQQYGFRFVIVGSKADSLFCKQLELVAGESAISIAGKTGIVQLIAIIRNSVLFVGNDSGPGHIAGALGVPTLIVSPFPTSCAIDHPNSPLRFRPVGPRVKVVQPMIPLTPCDPYCKMDIPHCIASVSVAEMFSAVQSMIDYRN